MLRRAAIGLWAAMAAGFAAPAEAAVEHGVMVIRGPGDASAERSVERNVRVWRGERAAAPALAETALAGGNLTKAAPQETKIIVIRCGRGLNHLRTQGFYSGHPGGQSRRFTQGFYSGAPDYRRCVQVAS